MPCVDCCGPQTSWASHEPTCPVTSSSGGTCWALCRCWSKLPIPSSVRGWSSTARPGGQSSQRPCAWGSSACRHNRRLRSRSWAGCANRRVAQPRPSPTHYDVGNEFYELVLGRTMAYSCAYYDQEPGAALGLDAAQLAKCDLVSRKLGLETGMRVLDVGCGWGAFVCNAARQYGVEAVGIPLSRGQADDARRSASLERRSSTATCSPTESSSPRP